MEENKENPEEKAGTQPTDPDDRRESDSSPEADTALEQDTKEDSPADIRKVIALLSKMIEGTSHASNIFEDSGSNLSTETETPTNAFANMFGGETPTPEKKEEKRESVEIMQY